MERAAVGGGEAEVEADLVGVVDGGGQAGRGVRTLQGLHRIGRADPLESRPLVRDQAAPGQRGQVAAPGPAQQVIAVRSVGADPAALRRLAVGERAGCGGRSHVGGRRVAHAVARQDAVEVGRRGAEPGVGEGGARAGPDLGPARAAVG